VRDNNWSYDDDEVNDVHNTVVREMQKVPSESTVQRKVATQSIAWKIGQCDGHG
jgi:hypothetical protein